MKGKTNIQCHLKVLFHLLPSEHLKCSLSSIHQVSELYWQDEEYSCPKYKHPHLSYFTTHIFRHFFNVSSVCIKQNGTSCRSWKWLVESVKAWTDTWCQKNQRLTPLDNSDGLCSWSVQICPSINCERRFSLALCVTLTSSHHAKTCCKPLADTWSQMSASRPGIESHKRSYNKKRKNTRRVEWLEIKLQPIKI